LKIQSRPKLVLKLKIFFKKNEKKRKGQVIEGSRPG
jgi:hypothetical protein